MKAQDSKTGKVVDTQHIWKPIRDSDTIMEVFNREGVKNPNYTVFVDNPPAWNPSRLSFNF